MSDTANKPSENKKKRILIVEDDVFLSKTYQVMLEKEGFEVATVPDGKEALATLAKPPSDLVLLDLMLPQVSGFDVLTALQKDAKWKHVPVIILTNLGQPQDIDKAKELRVAKYIVKATSKIADIVKEIKTLAA